jgi:aminoglycoside phosphotransferase (APT) family kinase protein
VKEIVRHTLELTSAVSGAADWCASVISRSAEGRLVLALERPGERLFAKRFVCPHDAVAARDALELLGSCRLHALRVPRPLVLDAEKGLLLMTAVDGRPLDGIDPAATRGAMRRAGVALSELHAQRLDGLRVLRLSGELRARLEPSLAQVAEIFPSSEHALRRLEAIVDGLDDPSGGFVPIHGDYQLRQLCDDGVGMGVVDWDSLAAGDPAYDVAYFVTYLINHARPASARAGIESFLGGYRPSRELVARAAVYEAFNYVRRCCRRLRLRDQGWREEARSMLARLDSSVVRIERGEAWDFPPRAAPIDATS